MISSKRAAQIFCCPLRRLADLSEHQLRFLKHLDVGRDGRLRQLQRLADLVDVQGAPPSQQLKIRMRTGDARPLTTCKCRSGLTSEIAARRCRAAAPRQRQPACPVAWSDPTLPVRFPKCPARSERDSMRPAPASCAGCLRSTETSFSVDGLTRSGAALLLIALQVVVAQFERLRDRKLAETARVDGDLDLLLQVAVEQE